MITFKEMVQKAQNNPNDPRNVELYNAIKEGVFDSEAKTEGVDISSLSTSYREMVKLEQEVSPVQEEVQEEVQKKSTGEKIAQAQIKAAEIINADELGEGLGNSLASGFVAKTGNEAMKQATDTQTRVLEALNQAKEAGDTEKMQRLEKALEYSSQAVEQANQIQQGFVEDLPSNREVIGSAISLAALAASGKVANAVGGKVASVAPSLVSGATTATGRIAQAGVQSAIQGATAGAAEATGRAIGEAESLEEGLQMVGKDALIGGVTGGVLGSGVQKITEVIDARTLRKSLSTPLTQSVDDLATSRVIPDDKVINKNIKTLKNRGFDEKSAKLVSTLNPEDKVVAKKMKELAETAMTDPRATRRPIDEVGDNFIKKLEPIKQLRKDFGKQVDEAAKAIKGEVVDNTQLRNSVNEIVSEFDINKIDGKYDFTNSVFDALPNAQKTKLSSILDKAGTVGDDAYKTHLLKKQVYELVDFSGKSADGLSGNAERLLKQIANSADSSLDEAFDTYRVANDDFKNIATVLGDVDDVFGRKAITTSKAGNKMRALFSNQQSRTSVQNLMKRIDDVSGVYGVGNKQRLLDQALFANTLEDLYGTQAVTSLQGEVTKAINRTQALAEGLRNPIQGVGSLVAEGVERVAGQTDEAKIKALTKLLQ